MVDQRISELTAMTAPASSDYLVLVDDTGGSPQTKRITVENFLSGGYAKGLFPIGGVIPVFIGMTGCPTPSTADGWAECDGTTAAAQGVASPVVTAATPAINSGAFIRGGALSWSSGVASGGSDTHTHAAGTFAGPSHTHAAGTLAGPSHTHTGTTDSGGVAHTHDVNIGSFASDAGTAHDHGSSGLYVPIGNVSNTSGGDLRFDHAYSDGPTVTMRKAVATTDLGAGVSYNSMRVLGDTADESSHTHSIDPPNTTSGAASATGHTHTFTSAASGTGAVTGSTGPEGTGAVTGTSGSASTLPVFFSAVYYMRCA